MMDWLSGAWPQIIGTLGLTLDIAGVVILFHTGLPSKAIRETAYADLFDKDMACKYDKLAWGAVAALVAGFCLQIAGTWLQWLCPP